MRPIRLELAGLNSYIGKQSVDFEQLTDRGLFGIFGSTGSGKSTILDAVTLAMYGNISRNTKEFINSSVDEVTLSFEFKIGNENNLKCYIVDRNIVRSDKGNKTSFARLVEVHRDGTKEVLAEKVKEVEKKIEDIIGLTANDFTRSVVLPQGKFSEFLQLTGSERRGMLERIFNLEKYGKKLIEKVRIRKNNVARDKRDLDIKLSGFEGVSKEIYDEIELKLQELKEAEKISSIDLAEIQKEYEMQNELYKTQEKLDILNKKRLNLLKKEDEIREKKKQIEKAEKAIIVYPHMKKAKIYSSELEDKIKGLKDIEEKYLELKKDIQYTGEKFNDYKMKKEEKISHLLDREFDLKRAKELEGEILELKNELKILSDSKERNKVLLMEVRLKESKLTNNIVDVENEIKKSDDILRKIAISSDLKQNIFRAFDLEEKYNYLLYLSDTKKEKLEQLITELNELKNKLFLNDKQKKIILDEIKIKNERLDIVLKKQPCSLEDIVNMNMEISNTKNLIKNIETKEKNKGNLENDLEEIVKNEVELSKKIKDKQINIDKINKNINTIEDEVEDLKILNKAASLRKELKDGCPCPVCGSKNHIYLEEVQYDRKIESLEDKLIKIKEKLQEEEINLRNLNKNKNYYENENKLKVNLISNIKSELNGEGSVRLQKKFDEKKKNLDFKKNKFNEWKKEKELLILNLEEFNKKKDKVEFEYFKLNEQKENVTKAISDLNLEINEYFEKIDEIKKKYLSIKINVKIDNLKDKVDEILKNEKVIEETNILKTSNYSKINVLEDGLKEICDKVYNLEFSLKKIEDNCNEKTELLKEKNMKLISITSGKPADLLLQETIKSIRMVNEEENILSEKLREKNEEYKITLVNKNTLESHIERLSIDCKIENEELNQLMIENRFKNRYEIEKSIIERKDLERLKLTVDNFEYDSRILNIKISELSEVLNDNKKVDRDYIFKLEKEIEDTKVKINTINKEIGAFENKYLNMKKSLEDLEVIKKEMCIVRHKFDLLEEMDKIIQGNRFVEFLAANQLKYISMEASKRLYSITKGRYYLEIDENLNFVMKDNFNGGERRSVDTLSGGETFLVSLSLALSLSSQIQLKGKAPLNFFFLDEGFGSLDSELLEIVMESFERLHTDDLSVGIISHIEELKNRVPIKLIVSNEENTVGSQVKIEYS